MEMQWKETHARFVQITATQWRDSGNEESVTELFGLDHEGRVWKYDANDSWMQMTDLAYAEVVDNDGR